MKRLDLLDYARFFAALAVVCFHYTFNGIANGKIGSLSHVDWLIAFTRYGYLGVEFFFMISGYVIFFSAYGRSAAQFALSRVLRLYPAFWTAVLLTAAVATVWGGAQMSVHLKQVLVNLSMVAPLFGQPFVDGVYWTLIPELSFYAMILALLLLGCSAQLDRVLLAWPFLIGLCTWMGHGAHAGMGGYFSYFAAGSVLAILKQRRSPLVLVALLVSLINCLLFATGDGLKHIEGFEFSPIVAGTSVAVFFLFFLFLNSERGSQIRLPQSRLIGGLTYPLYLVHAHIGYMLISRFATDANKVVLVPLVFVLMLGVAYGIHVVVEIRLGAWWKTLLASLVGRPVAWMERKATTARLWLLQGGN